MTPCASARDQMEDLAAEPPRVASQSRSLPARGTAGGRLPQLRNMAHDLAGTLLQRTRWPHTSATQDVTGLQQAMRGRIAGNGGVPAPMHAGIRGASEHCIALQPLGPAVACHSSALDGRRGHLRRRRVAIVR